MKGPAEQLDAMRKFKRAILEAAMEMSAATDMDSSFDGTSEWVSWGQMTKNEKEEYPEAQQANGFYRIGVEVLSWITL